MRTLASGAVRAAHVACGSPRARKVEEVNPNMETPYRGLHRARSGAARTIRIISETTPNDKTGIAEMYTIRGFSEVLFGEMYCSASRSAKRMARRRVRRSADDAAGPAARGGELRYGARDGRQQPRPVRGADRSGARAARPRQYAQAAAAVTGVPTTYRYTTFHCSCSG
jgi:hypothetical protein